MCRRCRPAGERGWRWKRRSRSLCFEELEGGFDASADSGIPPVVAEHSLLVLNEVVDGVRAGLIRHNEMKSNAGQKNYKRGIIA